MKPKKPEKNASQRELFRSRLNQILNHTHPLYVLAEEIEWSVFDEEFGSTYEDKVGRPGVSDASDGGAARNGMVL